MNLKQKNQTKAAINQVFQDSRFKIMADCAPVMLWMSGNDGRCIFFNQPWLDFSGKTLEEELGYGWAEGVHPEDFQHCMDTFMESFNSRNEFTMEYRLLRVDGEYRWILDNGRPYWNSDNSFAGFIGSCIDVTDLKQTKEIELEKVKLETQILEREKAAIKLQEAYKELEAFSYSVSHDLRAPLRSISGFVNALAKDFSEITEDSKALHYLDMLKESAYEMNQMIEDLLQFSKLNRQPLNKSFVNLNDMVTQIVSQLKEREEDRNISITISELPKVQADPLLLKNVLINLLDNAFKYTRKKEKSEIEVGHFVHSDKKGYKTFFVKDNGDGFDMKYADKLFGVFKRLHLPEEFEGTGVGLAICQRVIQRHGGDIWAESTKGKETTIYFTLPSSQETLSNVEAKNHA